MNTYNDAASGNAPAVPNGSGAAALLASAIGCFALAMLAVAGDKSATVKSLLVFYKPTGPLSGVTIVSIVVWLLVWVLLEWRWGGKTVALGRIATAAFVLLCLSFLLTFPPIADLL